MVLYSTVVAHGMPFHASVAAAKGALEGLTRSLAAEYAPKIRVNAVAPSLTQTPLAGKLLSSEENRKDERATSPEANWNSTGHGRNYLFSFESSSWMTGQIGSRWGMSSLKIN